jgi:membrane fusion protein (multidrug efflux system)
MTRTRIVLLVVLLALAGGGFWLWRHLAVSETTDDAQVDGHVYVVNARIGGALVAVNVHENQVVQAGEVLLQIDDRDFRMR